MTTLLSNLALVAPCAVAATTCRVAVAAAVAAEVGVGEDAAGATAEPPQADAMSATVATPAMTRAKRIKRGPPRFSAVRPGPAYRSPA